MLLIVSVTSSNDVKPIKSTMSIMELQSSKVLPNFQGQTPPADKWNHLIIPMEQSVYIENHFIEGKQFDIVQLDEKSFRVLGSPIEWE